MIAAVIFIVRGPARFPGNAQDFRRPYMQGRIWLHGINPFAEEYTTEHEVLGPDLQHIGLHLARGGYPPIHSPVMAVVGVFPWWLAKVVWLGLMGALFFLSFYMLWRMANLSFTAWSGKWFLLFMLLLAPIHTGFALGQPVMVAFPLGLLSVFWVRRNQWGMAGLAAGLSMAFKIQIGGVFLLYLLVTKRWRASLATLVVLLALVGIYEARLATAGTSTLGHDWSRWLSNVQGGYGFGGMRWDPQDPERVQGINLQNLLYSFTDHVTAVRYLTFGFVGILCLVYAFFVLRVKVPSHELLCLAVPCALALLPVYRRPYDAYMLVIPLAWALRRGAVIRLWSIELWLLVFLAGFLLLPGGAFLNLLMQQNSLPAWLIQNPLWNTVVLPYQNWSVLLLTLMLLSALASHATGKTDDIKRSYGLRG